MGGSFLVQISENGDLDCDAKLETLGKDIRVVESQLSQIVGIGESSTEKDNRVSF